MCLTADLLVSMLENYWEARMGCKSDMTMVAPSVIGLVHH